MSRLGQCFATLREANRRAVIPYLVAGDPDPSLTVPMMHALVAAGADIIEIGVPFSDPMSEGPIIQQGHERALAHGVSLRDVLGMVREFRGADAHTPLVLMGYANPVERMGYTAVADACAEAGIDGMITVDLPPEEVAVLNGELKRVGLDNIFLISPTTPAARMATIAAEASGFIYYVALKGVTGAGNLDTADVAAHLDTIRGVTGLPIAVGFGIKDATSAAAVAACADGVVVGSALVDGVAAAIRGGASPDAAVATAAALVSAIRRGVDAVATAA